MLGDAPWNVVRLCGQRHAERAGVKRLALLGIVMLLPIPATAQNSELPEGYVLDPPPCRDGKDECKPWERAWPDEARDPWAEFEDVSTEPEKLGPGPHTLVISDRDGITRMDYSSGAMCQIARDEVRRQTAPPPNTPTVIYGPSSLKAFCVPR